MLNPKANSNKLLAQSRMIQKTVYTNVRYTDDIFRSKVNKCCHIKKKKKKKHLGKIQCITPCHHDLYASGVRVT